jgi:hypothetical protein
MNNIKAMDRNSINPSWEKGIINGNGAVILLVMALFVYGKIY